jgi:hypothetical protein
VYVQIVGARRPLGPNEQPWNIMSDVRDALVVTDGALANRDSVPTVPTVVINGDSVATVTSTSTRSHWVRPRRPWILAP